MKNQRLSLLTVTSMLITISAALAVQTTDSQSFKGVNAVNIEMVSAEVTIESSKGKTVTVEITHDYDVDCYVPRLSQRGSRLYLEEDFHGRYCRGRATWHIKVPRKIDIDYSSASGNLTLSGVEGDIELSAASGDITVDDVKGDLDLDNASGRLEISNSSGTFDFDNASGRIRLKNVNGKIEVDNASGSVAIKGSTGSFEIDNASGDIDLQDIVFDGSSSFSTASGDIELALAKPLKYDLDMSTASGDVTLNYNNQPISGRFEFEIRRRSGRIVAPFDFDEEEVVPERAKRRRRSDRNYGNPYIRKSITRGGDSPRVEMRTSSGKVTLKKR